MCKAKTLSVGAKEHCFKVAVQEMQKKVPIIKHWLGREGQQFIQTLTKAD